MVILRVWKAMPGKYFCLSTKDAKKRWEDHFFSRSEFKDVPQFIRDNSDKDVYWCVHGFSKRRRRKEDAVLPLALWSDLDEADPRTLRFKPTIAIESSPGRFVGVWITDSEVTEELNRRLAYGVGADKSGWDLTQVLRVPGTTNYKYSSMPRVRILWSDGPEYDVKDLEKRLPSVSRETSNIEESDSAEVYKQWERKMPTWLRRELMAKNATAGKRSEMLWKLNNSLLELGVPSDDVFLLIRASVWNKFADRRNGDDQLRRELDKAINQHMGSRAPDAIDDENEGRRLIFKRMDQVQRESIDWLWYPYLARGELSILEGDPGRGKTYVAIMASIGLCDGVELPSEKPQTVSPAPVVYFTIENSASSVMKPRLECNGLKNFHNFYQMEEPLSVDEDDDWDEVIEFMDKYRPALAIFDTLNAYIGKADAYKGHEAQQAMIRFQELAKRFNCAVLVVRHLTKTSKGVNAIYRGQGNISFTGAARVVMTIGASPDNPDLRAMAVSKINVAKPPRALTFSVKPLPDVGGQTDRSKLIWHDFEDYTADEVLSTPPPDKDKKADQGAEDFLNDQLMDGDLEEARLRRLASARNLEFRALEIAADQLGVKRYTRKGSVWWSLPDDQQSDDD